MRYLKFIFIVLISIGLLSGCSTTAVKEIDGSTLLRQNNKEAQVTSLDSQLEKANKELAVASAVEMIETNRQLLAGNNFTEACSLYTPEYVSSMAKHFKEIRFENDCVGLLNQLFVQRMIEPNRIISTYGSQALTIPEFYVPSEIVVDESKMIVNNVSVVPVKTYFLSNGDKTQFAPNPDTGITTDLPEWFTQPFNVIKQDNKWYFTSQNN